jgi:PD-(D/E)XK nuclease superfamily protein
MQGKDAGSIGRMKDIEEAAAEIVDAAVKLHKSLGPGLLEVVYKTILGKELERRGLRIERRSQSRSNSMASDSIMAFALTSWSMDWSWWS